MFALAAKTERQRRGIEWAKEHFRHRVARFQVREVDVPENARLPGSGHQVAQNWNNPECRFLPVVLASSAAEMRNRYGGKAVQDRFPRCGNRSRMPDVGPQVAAVVDTGEYPGRVRGEIVQPHADAIGRRSVHGESAGAAHLNPDWLVRCHPMAAPGQCLHRGNRHRFAQLPCSPIQRF